MWVGTVRSDRGPRRPGRSRRTWSRQGPIGVSPRYCRFERVAQDRGGADTRRGAQRLPFGNLRGPIHQTMLATRIRDASVLSMAPENLFDQDQREQDDEINGILQEWHEADPDNSRGAAVFRRTFDQLYDGQHTGRYKWAQLSKTERTHFGTLIEINLRREFSDIILDGEAMDFQIEGIDIDCKYSQTDGGWMIPPEAYDFEHLLLVSTADDTAGAWSLGVVRASSGNLRTSRNRDAKTGLNRVGRQNIRWISRHAALPPNILLRISESDVSKIFSGRSGQARVNSLLRTVTNRRIGRNTIATVAQQDDYMKRVRGNGGARTILAEEGIIVLGGDYEEYRRIAEELGAVVPEPGEFVSLPLVPASPGSPHTTILDGTAWRIARDGEVPDSSAPSLPSVRRAPSAASTSRTER